MISANKILSRGLPKWPQMLVRGNTITIDQAKEIIRRTDTYFTYPEHSGNDTDYCRRVMRALGIPGDWDKLDEWRYDWGYIEGLEYVHNSWIACAYIYGPHGWCAPITGEIQFVDNVGKHPSCEDIFNEWKILANNFPFLDLTAVLMDKEYCEEDLKPVCGFSISQGTVIVYDPLKEDRLSFFTANPPPRTDDVFMKRMRTQQETAIPWEWIEEWSSKFQIGKSV